MWFIGNRQHVIEHWQYFEDHGRADATRVLFQVNWKDETIDPAWPNYREIMAEVIDKAYDDHGLRTLATLIGGGLSMDPTAFGNLVCDILEPRQEKILYVEIANEAYQNADDETVAAVAAVVRRRLPSLLLAASAYNGPDGVDFERTVAMANRIGASVLPVHLERSAPTGRQVRQAWDIKEFSRDRLISNQEPVGPLSSVAECRDARALAMHRALSIAMGAGAFVFHCGSLVYGVPKMGATGFRPARVMEVPDIDEIVEAVAFVEGILPDGVETWRAANAGWESPMPSNPVRADKLEKNYAAVSDRGFVSFLIDVQPGCEIVLKRTAHIRVFDPLQTHPVFSLTAAEGQPVPVPDIP